MSAREQQQCSTAGGEQQRSIASVRQCLCAPLTISISNGRQRNNSEIDGRPRVPSFQLRVEHAAAKDDEEEDDARPDQPALPAAQVVLVLVQRGCERQHGLGAG